MRFPEKSELFLVLAAFVDCGLCAPAPSPTPTATASSPSPSPSPLAVTTGSPLVGASASASASASVSASASASASAIPSAAAGAIPSAAASATIATTTTPYPLGVWSGKLELQNISDCPAFFLNPAVFRLTQGAISNCTKMDPGAVQFREPDGIAADKPVGKCNIVVRYAITTNSTDEMFVKEHCKCMLSVLNHALLSESINTTIGTCLCPPPTRSSLQDPCALPVIPARKFAMLTNGHGKAASEASVALLALTGVVAAMLVAFRRSSRGSAGSDVRHEALEQEEAMSLMTVDGPANEEHSME